MASSYLEKLSGRAETIARQLNSVAVDLWSATRRGGEIDDGTVSSARHEIEMAERSLQELAGEIHRAALTYISPDDV